MKDIHETVRANLKRLRKEQELTQEKLALMAGIHRAFIGQVEQGRKKLSLTSLHKIAIALKIDIRDFFDE